LIFCLGGGIGWGSILLTSGILFNLMWTLWWECNRRTFEDEEQSMAGLENILSLFEWSREWGLTDSTSILDYSLSLY
jgi:hypothetical protein